MQDWFSQHFNELLAALALPEFGLSTLFLVALASATLLPMGSEPAVIGLVELNPSLFWPAVVVATAGNSLGGAISWWMGLGAHKALDRLRPSSSANGKATSLLLRWGPKGCLLSWLPIVGDPLCAVAGWLRLPFWPCLFYMAIGKFARYFVMTWLWVAGRSWMGFTDGLL